MGGLRSKPSGVGGYKNYEQVFPCEEIHMCQTPPVAILNTSIVTAHGTYEFETCSLEQARELVGGEILSAVGHDSTAKILTTLLGRDVPVNRIEFKQEPAQIALVFKLRGRPPEGKILTAEEIESIGYDFGILTRFE